MLVPHHPGTCAPCTVTSNPYASVSSNITRAHTPHGCYNQLSAAGRADSSGVLPLLLLLQ